MNDIDKYKRGLGPIPGIDDGEFSDDPTLQLLRAMEAARLAQCRKNEALDKRDDQLEVALVAARGEIRSLKDEIGRTRLEAESARREAEIARRNADRSNRFIAIIPVIESMGVTIPDSHKGSVGVECKAIAIDFGDDPETRGKELIGSFPTWTYPRTLVANVARRWIAMNINRPDRTHWFDLWKIKVRHSGSNNKENS